MEETRPDKGLKAKHSSSVQSKIYLLLIQMFRAHFKDMTLLDCYATDLTLSFEFCYYFLHGYLKNHLLAKSVGLLYDLVGISLHLIPVCVIFDTWMNIK